jgi:hypothetical protein
MQSQVWDRGTISQTSDSLRLNWGITWKQVNSLMHGICVELLVVFQICSPTQGLSMKVSMLGTVSDCFNMP